MKRTMMAIAIVMVTFSLLAGNSIAASKAVVLRAGSAWPKTHDLNTVFFKFCGMVEKRTNGSVKIQWAGGPELFKASDLPTAAAAGSIDVFHSAIGYFGRKIPEAGIYDAYPSNLNYENFPRVYKEAFKFLGPLIEKKMKVKPLGSGTTFAFYLWTKKPVDTFEGLKGLKVRVHGGLAPHLIKALGISVVTMPSTDVYMALERGLIGGAYRNLSSFNNFREYEFCKFGIDIPLMIGGSPVFISLRRWAKLDEMQKKALADVGDEINFITAKFWKGKSEEIMSRLKSEGVQLFDPPPEFRAKWLRLMAEGGRKAALKMSPEGAETIIGIIEKYAR
jgi:TRAP-type C4-dicarboxylate transport system substrate-binding protein